MGHGEAVVGCGTVAALGLDTPAGRPAVQRKPLIEN